MGDAPTTEQHLEQWIGLARSSAVAREKTGPAWVASMRHTLDALLMAVQAIGRQGPGEPDHVARNAKDALAFLETIRDLSLDFARDRDLFASKFLRKKDFREILIECMRQLDYPSPGLNDDWSEAGSVSVASVLLLGSLLFPALAAYSEVELGAKIYAALGPDFDKRNKDPIERARDVLMAAGVDRKSADNLIDSAEAMQRKRAAERVAKDPQASPKPRKKRGG